MAETNAEEQESEDAERYALNVAFWFIAEDSDGGD